MPDKRDEEERDAGFCSGMDEKVGPEHCGCMKGRGAKAAETVRELLDKLRKVLDEMRAAGAGGAGGTAGADVSEGGRNREHGKG